MLSVDIFQVLFNCVDLILIYFYLYYSHTHKYVVKIRTSNHVDVNIRKNKQIKGKVIPLQARCGPESG